MKSVQCSVCSVVSFVLAATCAAQTNPIRPVQHTNGDILPPVVVSVARGGTGATNAAGARANLDFTNQVIAAGAAYGWSTNGGGSSDWSAITNKPSWITGATWQTNTNSPIFSLPAWISTNSRTSATNMNLGGAWLTNTPAQFVATRPQFYDDFSFWADGTVISNGVLPLFGNPYTVRLGGTNEVLPAVTNGLLSAAFGSVYYLCTELTDTVRTFGAEVTWNTNEPPATSWIVFLLKPDDTWLGAFLHVIVNEHGANIEWTTNGAGGLTGITNAYWPAYLPQGERVVIEGTVVSNTLTLRVGTNQLVATHTNIGQINGRFLAIEQFGHGLVPENTGNARLSKVWAGPQNPLQAAAVTPIARGGTGATNVAGAQANLGVGPTNTPEFAGVVLSNAKVRPAYGGVFFGPSAGGDWMGVDANGGRFYVSPYFYTESTNAPFLVVDANHKVGGISPSNARALMQIPWPGMTNTNTAGWQSALGIGATNDAEIGVDGGSLKTRMLRAEEGAESAQYVAYSNMATPNTNGLVYGWNGIVPSNPSEAVLAVARSNTWAFLGTDPRIVTHSTTNDSSKTSWANSTPQAGTNQEAQLGSWTISSNSVYEVKWNVWYASDATNPIFLHAVTFGAPLAAAIQNAGYGATPANTLPQVNTLATNSDYIVLPAAINGGSQSNRIISGSLIFRSGTTNTTMTYGWTASNNVTNTLTLKAGSVVRVEKIWP